MRADARGPRPYAARDPAAHSMNSMSRPTRHSSPTGHSRRRFTGMVRHGGGSYRAARTSRLSPPPASARGHARSQADDAGVPVDTSTVGVRGPAGSGRSPDRAASRVRGGRRELARSRSRWVDVERKRPRAGRERSRQRPGLDRHVVEEVKPRRQASPRCGRRESGWLVRGTPSTSVRRERFSTVGARARGEHDLATVGVTSRARPGGCRDIELGAACAMILSDRARTQRRGRPGRESRGRDRCCRPWRLERVGLAGDERSMGR